MNKQEAEEYTESLGFIVAGSWRQIFLAQRLGVPKVLGMTLREWVEDRLGGYIRLTLPERREAVLELEKEGMSTRQVADVLGVDHSTVAEDLAKAVGKPTAKTKKQAQTKGRAVGKPTAKCTHKCPVHCSG